MTSGTDATKFVQDISYPSHDANGNLTERQDALTGTTETFHNDFLNRLDPFRDCATIAGRKLR